VILDATKDIGYTQVNLLAEQQNGSARLTGALFCASRARNLYRLYRNRGATVVRVSLLQRKIP
jgi:hypothetical protein